MEEKQPFKVTDLSSLNWAMKKYKEKYNEIKEFESFCNEEKLKLDVWLEEVSKPIKNDMEYFESLIIAYMAQEREATGKKSISTPNGKVQSRESAESVQHVDKDKLLEYAIENGIDEAIKQTLAWTELKKRLAIADGKVIDVETGEFVEGATVKPATVSYKVVVE